MPDCHPIVPERPVLKAFFELEKRIAQTRQEPEMSNSINLEFTPPKARLQFAQKHLRDCVKGDLLLNKYHDPEAPGPTAGLYLVVNNYERIKSNKCEPFVINLRSGNTYTYEYMVERTKNNNGMLYLCEARIKAAVIRN